MSNRVFIATSLDGYIADRDGGLDWLHATPNPDELDFGYSQFMESIQAVVMGRKTFEVVSSFDIDWPYTKPVFIASDSLESIPAPYHQHVELVSGSPDQITRQLNERGFEQCYIDGGATIRRFLDADLIDELTITRLPILLGGGVPLFTELNRSLGFQHVHTEVWLDTLVQTCYRRVR